MMEFIFSLKGSIIISVVMTLIYWFVAQFKIKPSLTDLLTFVMQPIVILNNTNLLYKICLSETDSDIKCNLEKIDTVFISIGLIAIFYLSISEIGKKVIPLFNKQDN